MHDLKYRSLIGGRVEWEAVVTQIRNVRSECLKECAKAFADNLERTATFAIMPSEIAYMVRRDQILYDNAIFKLTGKGIDLKELAEKGPSLEVHQEAAKAMEEFKTITHDERVKLKVVFGINYIETLLDVPQRHAMKDSIAAMLASVVLGSWTAFECLASDLWAIGVDNGPKEVALRVSTSNHLQKSDENITSKTLLSLEFDPRTNCGSSLRETGRVSFQKLEHIKMYYGIAFDDECKKIFTDVAGGYVFALAAVRNALIHRSGIADKKFVDQAQRFSELKNLKANESILLDGELVKKLRAAAAEVGASLIGHVDKILTP